MADTSEDDEIVIFEPSYHLEWLLGADVEVVFEPDEESE